jgi:hypothetical protein
LKEREKEKEMLKGFRERESQLGKKVNATVLSAKNQ